MQIKERILFHYFRLPTGQRSVNDLVAQTGNRLDPLFALTSYLFEIQITGTVVFNYIYITQQWLYYYFFLQ